MDFLFHEDEGYDSNMNVGFQNPTKIHRYQFLHKTGFAFHPIARKKTWPLYVWVLDTLFQNNRNGIVVEEDCQTLKTIPKVAILYILNSNTNGCDIDYNGMRCRM